MSLNKKPGSYGSYWCRMAPITNGFFGRFHCFLYKCTQSSRLSPMAPISTICEHVPKIGTCLHTFIPSFWSPSKMILFLLCKFFWRIKNSVWVFDFWFEFLIRKVTRRLSIWNRNLVQKQWHTSLRLLSILYCSIRLKKVI